VLRSLGQRGLDRSLPIRRRAGLPPAAGDALGVESFRRRASAGTVRHETDC
jgi:hypothetical protein